MVRLEKDLCKSSFSTIVRFFRLTLELHGRAMLPPEVTAEEESPGFTKLVANSVVNNVQTPGPFR